MSFIGKTAAINWMSNLGCSKISFKSGPGIRTLVGEYLGEKLEITFLQGVRHDFSQSSEFFYHSVRVDVGNKEASKLAYGFLINRNTFYQTSVGQSNQSMVVFARYPYIHERISLDDLISFLKWVGHLITSDKVQVFQLVKESSETSISSLSWLSRMKLSFGRSQSLQWSDAKNLYSAICESVYKSDLFTDYENKHGKDLGFVMLVNRLTAQHVYRKINLNIESFGFDIRRYFFSVPLSSTFAGEKYISQVSLLPEAWIELSFSVGNESLSFETFPSFRTSENKATLWITDKENFSVKFGEILDNLGLSIGKKTSPYRS